jgi:hypothetical protein
MLFVDFEQPNRLRVNGVATVDGRSALPSSRARRWWSSADDAGVPQLRAYIHKMPQLVERSAFVPLPQATPPIPDWKRMTWAQDYLPEADPARGSEPIG